MAEKPTHPAYDEENQHLQQTLSTIDAEEIGARSWMADRRRELGDDDVANQLYEQAAERLDTLARARTQAYFGRVDLRSLDGDSTHAIYIGRHGVHKQATNEIVVHNWQAPIGRLFYQRRAGRTSYDTPDGIEHCDVLLRRNLQVDGDELRTIVDDFDMRDGESHHQVGDPYLVEVLNQQGSGYLQDIVATIQAEQDDVIRAEPLRPLVVQGVAGSGKTSVVFSRIAYLLYIQRATLRPENVLVVGPNRVFLQYTADLLPNLGIEAIRQSTFEELAEALCGRTFPTMSREEALEAYIQAPPEEQNRLRSVAQLKGSLRFRQVLDRLAARLARRGISRTPFEKLPNVSKEQLREWLAGDAKEPVNEQISRMVKRLHNQIENASNNTENKSTRGLNKPHVNGNANLAFAIELAWRKVDVIKVYKGLLSQPDVLSGVAKELLTADEVNILTSGTDALTDVDLAPLVHLARLVDGWKMDTVRRPGHVLVDEAEDLTPFELSILFDLTNHASFTLVGDLGQSVFSYRSPHEWQHLIEGVFGYRKATRANLLHSYRSTYEITMLANSVQARHQRADGAPAIPVERHGEEPMLKSLPSRQAWVETLVESVKAATENYTSVGVLAKDSSHCRAVARLLTKENLQPHLLLNSKAKFSPGLVVLPVHVARGLEFDAVVVADAQDSVYHDNLADATLLYVALTRPRHSLVVLAQGQLTPLLPSRAEQ